MYEQEGESSREAVPITAHGTESWRVSDSAIRTPDGKFVVIPCDFDNEADALKYMAASAAIVAGMRAKLEAKAKEKQT